MIWVIVAVVLSIVSFPLIANVLAKQSGWRKLAERYAITEVPKKMKGVPLNVWSASIGGFSYQNVLRMKSSAKGLIIWMTWPFSLSHKAIRIPWKAITKVEEHTQLGRPAKRLVVGDPVVTTIDLSKKDYNRVQGELRLKTIRK
ncbi:MAG: hypothetical protein AAF798_05585 [Bacteroidota bacterium]